MEKIKKFFNNDFYIIIIVAFLTTFTIPMISSCVFLSYNINYVEKESIDTDAMMLNTILEFVDKELEKVDTIAKAITYNSSFKQIQKYNKGSELNGEYVYDLNALSKEAKQYIVSTPFIEDIYILSKNSDMVVSSSFFDKKDIFFEKYYGDTNVAQNDWENKMNSSFYVNYIFVKEDNTDYIDIMYNTSFLSPNKNKDILTIRVSPKYLTDYFLQIYNMDYKTLVVLDKYDNLVLITDNTKEYNFKYADLSNSYDSTEIKSGFLSSLKSGYSSWKFVLFTDKHYVSKKVRYSKYIVIINVIVYLIMTIFFVKLYIMKNYIPIKNFMLKIRRNPPKKAVNLEKIADEYNRYRMVADKYKEINSMMHTKKFLNNLISFKRDISIINEEYQKIDMAFEYDEFIIILIDVYNYEGIFDEENIDITEKINFVELIITNIFEELFEDIGKSYVISKNEKFVCLINKKDSEFQWKEEMTARLEYGKLLIENQFNVFMLINVSSMKNGMENIHTAYTEVMSLWKKTKMVKNKEIFFYDDMTLQTVNKLSRDELVKMLETLLQTGDVETSMLLVEKIVNSFTENPADIDRGFKVYLLKIIDSASSVLGTEDKTSQEFYQYINKILEFESYELCISHLKSLIEYTCQCVRINSEQPSEEQNGEGNELIAKIKEFIEREYKNNMFTTTSIGEHVGVTPYYASRIFKAKTNESLADYISRRRIEKAKEILDENPDISTKELYAEVGFGSVKTFTRIFDKCENITIGQYRKILKQQQKK